jgi:hypothetical protein
MSQTLNKELLKQSSAGIRMIAQMTIYNSGDFRRLRAFVAENYHETLLAEQPVAVWLAMLRTWRNTLGRLRVRQVIGTDTHQAIVLMESEKGQSLILHTLRVDTEYPHKVVEFTHVPLEQTP